MDSSQLQTLFQEKMETMPNKARRVVEYLLSHMREAAFQSIAEVAQELQVSKAQLVRVARMLGFKGYTELKLALQEAILEQVNPAAMLAKVIESKETLPEKILQIEHANLDDTWRLLTEEKISRFIELVPKATTIYCLGWGISSLVAESLHMRLRVMGLNGTLMKRGSLSLTEQARAIRKDDMLIVCELPSYVAEVTEVTERSAAQGAVVVTITDSPAAPVCRHASLSFFVTAASPTFGSSILSPLFLAHVLTSALATNLGESARKALEEQAQYLHDRRIFHPIFGLKY